MDPNYMRAVMQGEISSKKELSKKKDEIQKSKLDIELDKKIDDFVDTYQFEDDPSHRSMQNLNDRRERLKLEIKTVIELPELSQQIDKALGLLFSEGSRYLSKETCEKLMSDLSDVNESFEEIGIQEASNSNLEGLTPDSMRAITEIALAKFEETRYEDCLALFSFLSMLNPGDSEYWFRMGIAAQKNNNIDLALRAYAATLELDPHNIGARLFSAECFALKNLLDEAKIALASAKDIAKSGKIDQMWLNLIIAVESLVNSKKMEHS